MARRDVVLSERIDRNGTKHQVVETNCSRCGGAGGSDKWIFTGKTCYKCGGHGRQQEKRKIYTPEHQAKLDAQREKRAEKKRQEAIAEAKERNKKYLEEIGFHKGKIYAVLSENTYGIKEALKEAGAIWGGRIIGWYFSEKPSEWETFELETEQLIRFNQLGEVYKKDPVDYADYVKGERKKLSPQTGWIGEVGERKDFGLTIISSFEIDTQFGWSCINALADAEGNKFIWKTQHDLSYTYGQGEVIKLKGTIKEHNEYKGEKQTILTRCKIID